jgi:hypothetical protein
MIKILITEQQFINVISQVIDESLPLSLAKEYSSIQRDEKIQKQINDLWDRLVETPNSTKARNGNRIYIPYINEEDENPSNNIVKNEVADFLNSKGYKLHDYFKGTVIEPKYGRETKIGKIIDNPELLKKFNNDEVRRGYKKKNSYIVLSRHPYDIAGMSTNRGWTSCMSIDRKENPVDNCSRYVKEDIKYGTIVAYFIDKNDLNINDPIGRVLIKPYLNEDGVVIYNVSSTTYGSPPAGFKPQLESIFDLANSNKRMGMYSMDEKLYAGDDPFEVFNISIKRFERLSNQERLNFLEKNHFSFQYGVPLINIQDKYNFINTNGELIFKTWFDRVEDFYNGFALVILDKKMNYVNQSGRLLSKTWFNYGYDFSDGLGQIQIGDKWNFINEVGEIISEIWFDEVEHLYQYKLFRVKLDDKWNLMNKKGKIIFKTWVANEKLWKHIMGRKDK